MGFTLLEVLIVTVILMSLAVLSLIMFNPIKQIQKANNARRMHDLTEYRNAVEVYYNDKNKYPWDATIIGGAYIKKIPKDPGCDTQPSNCHNYVYITSARRQWFILMAKLEGDVSSTTTCPYSCLSQPNHETLVDISGYNYCVTGGIVDQNVCEYGGVTPTPLPSATPTPVTSPTATGTPGPTGTPTPILTSTPTPVFTATPTPTSTPTPTPLACEEQYACTGQPSTCNRVSFGLGMYCGAPGCFAGECCNNQCL